MRALACVLLLGAVAQAVDLSKVDRKIAARPKFTAERQFYALLVLGPEAKTKVWFVADGDVLHVDRNGNGDLTDDGEPVRADASREASGFVALSRSWKVGGLAVSPRYSNVEAYFALVDPKWRPDPTASNRGSMERYMAAAARTPHANSSFLFVTIDGKRRQGGSAMFRTSPEEAPILHMDAPLTLGVIEPLVPGRLERGPDAKLRLFVGTPGSCADQPACFSYITYDELPADARPVVDVEFPAAKPGEHLPPVRFTLDGKC